MSYRIRHADGRWLKTCAITAFAKDESKDLGPDNAVWTIVPGWIDDPEQTVNFNKRVDAEAVAGMLQQRGFECEMVEETG